MGEETENNLPLGKTSHFCIFSMLVIPLRVHKCQEFHCPIYFKLQEELFHEKMTPVWEAEEQANLDGFLESDIVISVSLFLIL